MFTGKTKNLGIIGWPVAHSFSPAMQNAALQKAGLDFVYVAMPVEPADLEPAVNGLRSLNFRGVNVTIPHKTAIIPLLDEVTEDAQMIGAVNTVVNDHGRLRGYNTDVQGFMKALTATGFSAEGLNVAVLGAGGAARAALWGLIKAKAQRVYLGVRNPGRAELLVKDFRAKGEVKAYDWLSDEWQDYLSKAELIINTTPLGMAPKSDAMPPVNWEKVRPGAFVYDVIYTPAKTRFLQEAEARKHPILNGEAMLVQQGAASFRLWTGETPDTDLMRKVLREALQNK
ncbi:MAG: shikimate dehydrogenase [Selenomonadaceae bacterium]|nr:shikimate dehydrogenase [Selenomonadaceae bacterium]